MFKMINKIKPSQFFKFKGEFYHGIAEHYKSLRFGQAFLNEFFPNIEDAQLFYCEDSRLAERIIFIHYIE
jgi:5'(3')-deoxyribonucleotidase